MSISINELDVEKEPGPPPSGKFYGKYRGLVVNNIDKIPEEHRNAWQAL